MNATRGKTVVVGVPAVVLLMLMSVGCGHSSSWQYGYDHSGSAGSLIQMNVPEDSACRSVAGLGTRFDSKLDYDEVMEGCFAGLRD